MGLAHLCSSDSPHRAPGAALARLCAAFALVFGLGACASLGPGDYDGLFSGGSAGLRGAETAAGNYLAARYAGSQRDAKAAATYFAKALDADPDNPVILESAFLLELSAGHVEPSVELADRLIERNPGARMARLVRAVKLMKAGRFDEAGRELDAAPPRSLSDLVWVTQRAWAYAGAGETDLALAQLSAPKAIEASGAFGLFHLALILDYAGRNEEAERAYLETIDVIGGRSVRLVQAYGRFLERTGRGDEAVDFYNAQLAEQGSHPLLVAARARALGAKESGTGLVTTAQDGAAEALYGIAGALAGDGVVEIPVTYLQLALYLRPDLDLGWALLAEFREEQLQWEEAARTFAKIPASSPLASSAAVSIARNLTRLDRTDEAITLLETRIRRYPDDLDSVIALADQLRLDRRFDEAAALYGRAMKMSGPAGSNYWQIAYARGIALERAGRWREAEPLFHEALEYEPNEPQVLNYLGYSWIDRGENLEQALELIYKAVDQRPNDGYIVDSLGWAYYRLGDYETAVYYLERAVELRPEDPTINDHLGDAYWQVGRRREAEFQWNHAITFTGDPAGKRAIERKLKSGTGPKVPKPGS